ncbi:hypothetical protein [Paraburkholderia antibiotica]|uniref:hypothetical protein n=1 Tax=Paraburkholderia antibiotica TaxID=2728839 RepID=UPI00197DA6D6|nr:hypothetical protein [Paraburkholderia antibiotica]
MGNFLQHLADWNLGNRLNVGVLRYTTDDVNPGMSADCASRWRASGPSLARAFNVGIAARYQHVIVPLLLCSLCLVLATLTNHQLLALALLFFAGIGLGGAQSVFWTIPTSFLTK